MPVRSKILIAVGAVLFLGSLVLFGVLWLMTDMAQDKSENIVRQINDVLPVRSAGVADSYSDMHMPVLEIDGEDFVALVSIPDLEVTLPVGSTWDSEMIQSYPRRIGGAVYDGTLEIGVTDRKSQFSFFRKLDIGTNVIVTDMTGAEFSYTVYRVDRSDSLDDDIVRDDNTDFVFINRDTYLMESITVYCTADK